jgi:2-dehydro-3-deoxyphosphogluconate aldolase/(4S)-4-hydroxy-2-oxoglutarate aldolase
VLLEQILTLGPVVPVIVINDLEHAVPLAHALVAGGLPVLEVSLRTSVAMEAIQLISDQVPEVIVGVGTVTRPEQFETSTKAGARFMVSPALTPALLKASRDIDTPFLPGVLTPTEALCARDEGFNILKLFPAEQAGGTSMLRAMGSQVAELKFCPAGGIGPSSVMDYLKLPNVLCVGGSWVAPVQIMQSGNWELVTQLASEVVRLARKG